MQVKLDTKVKQFIKEEINKKFQKELTKAKDLWQKNFLLEQVRGIWEKEWDKEWREIWQ